MTQIIEKKNQELDAYQRKQEITLAIQKVGQLTENDFYKKRSEFKNIRNLSDQEVSIGAAILITRLAVFTGLKEDINPFIKQDIVNGLITNHRDLSFEEIEYAFSLDRDGMFGEPTPHYQFLNREYIGRVLRKYRNWLDRKREHYRIRRF